MKKLIGYVSSHPHLFNKEGQTVGYNGNLYTITDPQSIRDYITPRIIAESLARQCRYLGNTRVHYSVARHSVRGAEAALLMGNVDLAKQFLFHDAAETLHGDQSKPFKIMISENWPDYVSITNALDKIICDLFDVTFPYSPELKVIDSNLAIDEMTSFMRHYDAIYGTDDPDDDWRGDVEAWMIAYRKISIYEHYDRLSEVTINSMGEMDTHLKSINDAVSRM